MAGIQLGNLTEARRWVAAGIATASAAGLDLELAELRATSALLWFLAESPDRALGEIDDALTSVSRSPAAAGTLHGQRAHLMFRLGRHGEGLAATDDALSALDEAVTGGPAGARPPETVKARILSNRGLAHCYRDEHEPALTDLEEALALHRLAGAGALEAQSLHNLAFATGRMGDVPLALRRFDEAAAAYARAGLPTYRLDADRAALLAAACLVPEAREALAASADELDRAGFSFDAAEVRLSLAEASLVDHDPRAAEESAAEAEAAFTRQGRSAWAVLAREVTERGRRAELARREEWGRVAASAGASARALDDTGWRAEAAAAAVVAAQAAHFAGSDHLVDRYLRGGGHAGGGVQGGSAAVRLHGEALRLLAGGRRDDAMEHLREGVGVAAAQAGRMRTDTGRTGHGATAAAVAETGLSEAVGSRSASAVLEWAERRRIAVRTPHLGWQVDPQTSPHAGPQTSPYTDWQAASAASVALAVPVGGNLVEFVCHRRRLWAVVAGETRAGDGPAGDGPAGDGLAGDGPAREGRPREGRPREALAREALVLVEIGPLAPIEKARAALHFAITRLTGNRPSPSRQGGDVAMWALLRRSAADLDRRLHEPLREVLVRSTATTTGRAAGSTARLPGSPITIVPSGVLHDLPWGMLRSFRDRCVTVAPSAWGRPAAPQPDRSSRVPARPGSVLLVAGPGLRESSLEVEQLAQLWRAVSPSVRALVGPAATTAAVLDAFGTCDLAHLAVHGRFRADNPDMSSFRLAGGDLTVHELRGLARTPRTIVLSACDAARVVVQPGEELAGPVPVLLESGDPTSGSFVIASVGPLADSAMPIVSLLLHERLAANMSPPEALATLRAGLADPLATDVPAGDLLGLAAGCLVCHGRPVAIGDGPRLPGATGSGLGECPP